LTGVDPSSSVRIVIPIVAGIGNALMAVPMVRQLKRKLPNARITILARVGAMGEPFRRLKEVDEVIVSGGGVKGTLRMLLAARRKSADFFLVPFPSNRWEYSFLAALSGAKTRVSHSYPVGYWRALHFLPSRRIPAQRGIHDVQQNVNLLRALELTPDPIEPPTFIVCDDDRARAAAMLDAAGIGRDDRPIIIHAGSAQTVLAQAKRWPPRSYAKLIDALQEEFGDRIVIVEGPDEAGVAAEILNSRDLATSQSSPRIIRLAGPLGEAAALLERAQLYVGSDSGLAHLAAAVGTRAVTLFAPADPDRVCPFAQRDLVVQAPVPCSPCAQYPWHEPKPRVLCREPLCINTITVEAVLAKVRAAVGERVGAAS
jgi:ADP-heptose:LPS heptosyltransferase